MELAVEVRNGCKKFGKSAPVLDNLNLSVQKGSIYGLLGASGCGKTTLLSCIVGLQELDSGDIFVFGSKPGTKASGIPGHIIGYMPQEIALITIFTIKEMLYYYGRIYGMEKSEIKQRTKFLTVFLELPDTSKLIGNLSGGQLRRVSFAVALIHRPPLIILDEPTVGLDPVLRESIWEHLLELVTREKTTIIITTHYINEANYSNTVGILRKGSLLAEASPESLLSLHNSISLEKVVLKLCHDAAFAKRNSSIANLNPGQLLNPDNGSRDNDLSKNWRAEHFTYTGVELTRIRKLSTISYGHPLDFNSSVTNEKLRERSEKEGWRKNARIVGALMRKTLLRQIRHPAAILVQLLLPLLQILIYENIVGVEPKGSTIAYVSNDWNHVFGQNNNAFTKSELLEYCSKTFSKNGSCLLQVDDGGMNSICGFMNEFDANEIRWTYRESVAQALDDVKSGKLMGYVEFPSNFTNYLRDRLLEKNFIGNESLLGSIINIRMDESAALNKEFVRTTVMNKYQAFIEKSVAKCGIDPRMIQLPLNFHGIYGKENGSWTLYIQPGLIIMYMFVLANLPSVVLVMEKREGVADRGAVAGIKFGHILLASFLSDSVMILAQIGIFFVVLPTFYGMQIEGSWITAVALVYLSALSGLSCGLWWATMTSHEMELILVLLFVNITNILSTGMMWPLEAVIPSYRVFCLSLPVSFPMQALRAVMFKGWGLGHPLVIRGFVTAALWTLIPILISFLFYKFRK